MNFSKTPAATTPAVRFVPQGTPRQGAQAVAQSPDKGSGILHYAMLTYVFLFCSRISEFIPQARISAVLLVVLLMTMALTMRSGLILKMPAGRPLMLLTAWVGVCVPFSVWVGGSATVLQSAIQSLLTVAVMAAYIRTTREAVRAMYTVGFAMTCAAGLSFLFGTSIGGRLEIGVEGNTFGDPNFYCYYVITGLPFLIATVFLEPGLKRLMGLGAIVPVLYVAAQTGSRGGMVALMAGLLFLFLFSPGKQKAYFLAAAVLLIPIAAALVPETTVKRFVTIFNSETSSDVDSLVAKQSGEARKYLFRRSLELTAQNPITGVGPGQFMVAEAADAKADGARGAWHVSHNTYTQFSSEMGLPGAGLFLAAMGVSFFGLSGIRKRHPDARMKRVALMMQMSLVIVAVAAVFLSLGYSGLHYAVIALCGVFQAAVRKEGVAVSPPAISPQKSRGTARAPWLPRPRVHEGKYLPARDFGK